MTKQSVKAPGPLVLSFLTGAYLYMYAMLDGTAYHNQRHEESSFVTVAVVEEQKYHRQAYHETIGQVLNLQEKQEAPWLRLVG